MPYGDHALTLPWSTLPWSTLPWLRDLDHGYVTMNIGHIIKLPRFIVVYGSYAPDIQIPKCEI